MKSNALTNTGTQVNITHEVSKFALTVGIATAALIGLWACACMISVLATNGLSGVVKGLITAVSGV